MEAGFPVYILPKQVLVRCSFDFQPYLPWSSPAKLPTRLVGQHLTENSQGINPVTAHHRPQVHSSVTRTVSFQP